MLHEFSSFESTECERYLSINRPLFVFTSDGGPNTRDQVLDLNQALACRSFIYRVLQRGIDVALLDNVSFNTGKSFAFHLESEGAEFDVELPSLPAMESLNIQDVKVYTTASARRSVMISALASLVETVEGGVIKAFIASLVACENLDIHDRAVLVNTDSWSKFSEALEKFYRASIAAVKQIDVEICDLADYFDGRVFLAVMQHPCKLDTDELFAEVYKHAGKSTPDVNLPSLPVPATTTDTTAKKFKLLPFSDPIFDRNLSAVKVDASGKETSGDDAVDFSIIQQQTGKHHSGMEKKLLQKEKGPELTGNSREDIWIKKRFQANRDRQMAHIKRAAESLTGVNGAGLDRMAIISGQTPVAKPTKSTPVPSRSSTPVPTEKKPKKETKKAPKLTKAQQIIANNTAEKAGKKAQKSTSAWAATKTEVDSYKDLRVRLEELDRYINSPARAQRDVDIQLEMELYRIQILLDWWKKNCKDPKCAKSEPATINIAVKLFDAINVMYRNKNLTTNIKETIDQVLVCLGLSSCVDNEVRPTSSKDISFEFDVPKSKTTYNVPFNSTEFQMKFCGQNMERNMESAPDSRTNFDADKWQRDVLDVVDREENVFVVAPTSAGKTFISFYAIEKVLRADDEGMLVFIAPTKALCNQMAAEIEARYSKNYKTQGGKSVWAIHTGDYKIHDPEKCQVLVTVPQVLQKLLLSPAQAQRWSPKIKRIIFDEIHCVNGEEGTVWEQLLMMAPCPIVALSATVGNPTAFANWLSATQAVHKRKVVLVHHGQRYSDLRKFVYIPAIATAEEFHNGEKISSDTQGQFRDMHPASALHFGPRVMPDDLGFEPRDCYNIYEHMSKLKTPEFDMPEELEPNKYFADHHIIRKADVVVYQKKIKEHLAKWLADPNSRDKGSPFARLMEALDAGLRQRMLAVEKRWATLTKESVAKGGSDTTMLEEAIVPMVEDLDAEGLLPALCFNYSRSQVEKLGEKIVTTLEEREADYRQNDPAWQRKIKAYEKWLGDADKRQKEKERALKRTKKNADKDEDAPEEPEPEIEEGGWQETFDPSAPDPDYSFVGLKNTYGDQDMAMEISFLEKRGACPVWMLRGLRRGVGIHHSGLNRRYRQLVEVAFRSKFLRVVISTGTLALGINMPATSAVFVGDGAQLTALNFRQAAGRAGRRGYDVLGHVGFCCVPMDKIDRLLVSRIPSISGHFPISTTLLLRTFNLLKNSNRSPFAQRAVEGLFINPEALVNAIGDVNASKSQILYHIRFAIEYLRRERLINAAGQPINLAAPVSHLYYEEPSNFAFAALLRGGVFHEICREFDNPKKRAQICRRLVFILAQLFGRIPMRPEEANYRKATHKKAIGHIALPPLAEVEPAAEKCLQEHDDRVITLYKAYVATFTAQEDVAAIDSKLPFSGQDYAKTGDFKIATVSRPTQGVFSNLSSNVKNVSMQDIVATAPRGVFIDGLSPQLTIANRKDAVLNAYAYDFYVAGENKIPPAQAISFLVDFNGIPKARSWFVLADFSTVLASIEESLSTLLGITDDEGFDIMAGADSEQSAFDEDEADSAIVGAVPTNPNQVQPTMGTQKAKVEADWMNLDQSDSDDDDNDSGYGSNVSAGTYVYRDTKRVFRAFQLVRARFNFAFKQTWS